MGTKSHEPVSNPVMRDVLYSLRQFAKAPGFAFLAVLCLGLGIGVNASIFSVLNSLYWRPLPVVAPERLVWEHSFSDENGGLTRHPLSPTWPLKLLTTVTFDEPRKGQTGLTLRWSPIGATAEEQKTFDDAHEGMRNGWGGTFERLTAYLAEAK